MALIRTLLSLEDYLDWTLLWTLVVREALSASGSLFLNLGASPSRPLLPHSIICAIVDRRIFVLQNTFHWVKSIAIPRIPTRRACAARALQANQTREGSYMTAMITFSI